MQPDYQSPSQPVSPQSIGPVATPPVAVSVVKTRTSALVHIAWVVVAFAVAAGIYLWQHDQVSSLNTKLSAAQTSLKVAQKAQAATGQYVANSAAGVPISLKTKKIVTTLSLPDDQAALNLAPDATTQEGLASYFATSFNDILANWQFQTQGTPDSPSNASTTGSIFVSDMTQWAATADAASVDYPNIGAKQMAVADKKSFVPQLKTATTACANNSAKGFATNDKVFDICFGLVHPQAVNGDWYVNLEGYGEPASLPVYFGGSINVGPDATYKATMQKYIDVLKQFKTSVVANS